MQDRQYKQILFEYKNLKKENEALSRLLQKAVLTIKKISTEIDAGMLCDCLGELHFVFDNDLYIIGIECLSCGKQKIF